MRPPLWLRKLIRPLIPDRVMARYRLHEHSRQVRVNVDVFLPHAASQAERRRWLLTTPDTYRVRPLSSLGAAPSEGVEERGDQAHAEAAARMLADPRLDAAAVAGVARPRLVGRRRVEPAVDVRTVALRPAWLEEIGGLDDDGGMTVASLWDRLRDAGAYLGLAPLPEQADSAAAPDPITADPVVIFSLVPMHDVGGGSRGAQLALHLARRGYHVTHVALYGTAESVDLGLRFLHPRLQQRRFTEFDAAGYLGRLPADAFPLVVVEAPVPALAGTVRSLRAAGATVIYDLIDDWSDPSLGGDWWQPDAEEEMVGAADVLVASAPDLAARLERFGRPVTLLPNGVDADLFSERGDRPADLPDGEGPIIGYHGTLDADWLDWAAVARVAKARPDAPVVMIGDDKGARPPLPPNVTFLGLKPQRDLPPYVSRFDVGLIPFAVTEMTHAVSPLKIYEYLAAGVPVAAPPLRAIQTLTGVHTRPDLADAVDAALAADRPDAAAARREHSWDARVEALLRAAGREPAPPTSPAPRVVVRPAIHYRAEERAPGW